VHQHLHPYVRTLLAARVHPDRKVEAIVNPSSAREGIGADKIGLRRLKTPHTGEKNAHYRYLHR
jgi:hypothetical protein